MRPLTPRERMVLRLTAQGFTDVQIADRLYIETSTVRTHQESLREKLQVHNRVQLTLKTVAHPELVAEE